MVERYVFVKLKPEHATEQGRAEVMARSQRLTRVPGLRGLRIGAPADAAALAAWDLCLVARFETLAAIAAYLEHEEHVAYHDGFLEPRVQVIKAWNFQV
jgi:hypothetical protein